MTSPNTEQRDEAVTEADRDFLKALRDEWLNGGDGLELIARHRIAAENTALERAAKCAEKWYPDEEAAGCEATWADAAHSITASILALKTKAPE